MKRKKLRLHRETIRRLDPDRLSRVAGGDSDNNFTDDCYSNPSHCNCNTTEYSCGGDEGDTRPVQYCNSTGWVCPD